jgi:hypothetical protein
MALTVRGTSDIDEDATPHVRVSHILRVRGIRHGVS